MEALPDQQEQNSPSTFAEFWACYVRAHHQPWNRRLHFIGTFLVLVCLIMGLWTLNYFYFIAMPIVGYGFAWVGHIVIEKGRPATFHAPVRSLLCDFYMFYLMLIGRMDQEIERTKRPRHS